MPDAETLTETGMVLGTPGYLAPEQAKGLTPGPPADVFGLAATLYYAIEGVGPFHRDGYLPMLSAYARHDIRAPKRAGALAPALVRMLTADPAKRPTAEQAREMLGSARRRPHLSLRLAFIDGDAWRHAAYAFQIFGAMFLLALGLHRVLFPRLVALTLDELHQTDGFDVVDAIDLARAMGWALVLVAALIRRHRSTTGLAVFAAAVEVVRVASWYQDSPSHFLSSAWWATVALLVAATSVWLVGSPPAARPRAVWWFGGALACAAGASLCDFWQSPLSLGPFPGLGLFVVDLEEGFTPRFAVPLYLVAVGLAGWTWWRQGGPVRRRLLALAAPIGGIAAMVKYGFAGFMYSSQQFPSPIMLVPAQWAVLGATPVLAFALAVFFLNRWERPNY